MNKIKLVWDMFILVLAVLTSFSVGFEFVIKSLDGLIWYRVVSLTADVIFGIDIFVQFRTTYFSVEGEEVRDWKKIARRYMRGMFIFDFIAAIPWGESSI